MYSISNRVNIAFLGWVNLNSLVHVTSVDSDDSIATTLGFLITVMICGLFDVTGL